MLMPFSIPPPGRPAVRNAASEIKADMSEMKESAQAVFKEDEETSKEKESV